MGLFLSQSQNLMAVLALVFTAADMDPVVATIGGFHDELVVIRVGWSHENQLWQVPCRYASCCRSCKYKESCGGCLLPRKGNDKWLMQIR